MGKNAEARKLFTKNSSLLSFYVFSFSCFSTAATETKATAKKIPLHCCALFISVLIEDFVATMVSSMAIFVVHAVFNLQQSNGEN